MIVVHIYVTVYAKTRPVSRIKKTEIAIRSCIPNKYLSLMSTITVSTNKNVKSSIIVDMGSCT